MPTTRIGKLRKAALARLGLAAIGALMAVIVISACADLAQPKPFIFKTPASFINELDPMEIIDCGPGYSLDSHYPNCEPCDSSNPYAQPGCEYVPTDPCLLDPNAPGCGDPCSNDPFAPGCPPPCDINPDAEGCTPTDDGTGEQSNACNDERDRMFDEYATYGVIDRPASCTVFTTSGGTAEFSWTQLNGGWADGNEHRPYGWIRGSLLNGLTQSSDNYWYKFFGSINVRSGYRCPAANSRLANAAAQSYHIRGRAADMYGLSMFGGNTRYSESAYNRLAESVLSTYPRPVEIFSYFQYTDHHLHAAW